MFWKSKTIVKVEEKILPPEEKKSEPLEPWEQEAVAAYQEEVRQREEKEEQARREVGKKIQTLVKERFGIDIPDGEIFGDLWKRPGWSRPIRLNSSGILYYNCGFGYRDFHTEDIITKEDLDKAIIFLRQSGGGF